VLSSSTVAHRRHRSGRMSIRLATSLAATLIPHAHTPTPTSWLRRVERWSVLLTNEKLRRGAQWSDLRALKDSRACISLGTQTRKPMTSWRRISHRRCAEAGNRRAGRCVHRSLCRTSPLRLRLAWRAYRIQGPRPAKGTQASPTRFDEWRARRRTSEWMDPRGLRYLIDDTPQGRRRSARLPAITPPRVPGTLARGWRTASELFA
jgi:hypothetical protein